jgi:hypothetical protein
MSAPNFRYVDLDDGRVLNINVTHEGIILDVYGLEGFRNGLPRNYDGPETHKENVHLGTAAMTFPEWADWVVQTDRSQHFINRLVQAEGGK